MDNMKIKTSEEIMLTIDNLNSVINELNLIESYIKGYHIYLMSEWTPVMDELSDQAVFNGFIDTLESKSENFTTKTIDVVVDYDAEDKHHAYKINNRSRRFLVERWFNQIRLKIQVLKKFGWDNEVAQFILKTVIKLNNLIPLIISNCSAKSLLTLSNENFNHLVRDIINPIIIANKNKNDRIVRPHRIDHQTNSDYPKFNFPQNWQNSGKMTIPPTNHYPTVNIDPPPPDELTVPNIYNDNSGFI